MMSTDELGEAGLPAISTAEDDVKRRSFKTHCKRRTGVTSGALVAEDMSGGIPPFTPPVNPKSGPARARLMAAMHETVLTAGLEEEERAIIVDAMLEASPREGGRGGTTRSVCARLSIACR